MKKTLLTLALAGTMLGICNDVFSQRIKEIDLEKVKSVETFPAKGKYSDRLKKMKSIQDGDYKDMLLEAKDARDAEIYCTRILESRPDIENVDSAFYGENDYWASFKESYHKGIGDCDDGTIAAAALLYDDGFPPYFLLLEGGNESHIVFLYKNQEGKFGTLGKTLSDCRRPRHKDFSKVIEWFEKLMNKDLEYKILDASRIFPKAIHSEGKNYDCCF